MELSEKSIAYQFLSEVDLNNIFTSQDPQRYRFPITNSQIDSIISIPKPDDIDITQIDPKDQYFHRFIQQVTVWIRWFDKFGDIFQYVIERFKTWKMEGAEQLFMDICTIKHDPETTVFKMRTTIQQLLKIFNSFDNLDRFCDLFDYLQPFKIICNGTLSQRDEFKSYMEEVKKSFPNNTFTVNGKSQGTKEVHFYEHQRVHWSVACTQHHCNIKVEYRLQDASYQTHELYNEKDVTIDKNYLYGKFETQHSGQLIITINNQNPHTQRVIWYSVKQDSVPTCYLFQGILDMYYQKYFKQSAQLVREKELSQLITRVFSFIDNLLNGDTTLQDMDCLKIFFHEKNVNVRNEVQKLFTNRSKTKSMKESMITNVSNDVNNDEIEQVCNWLRIYQYSSHLNDIITCMRIFKIVSNNEENDQSINNLIQMNIQDNCTLKEIPEIYKELNERFRKLTNHHLQLIKIVVECSNVVELMKNANLYSTHGLRRFHELRDNLTTQFQLQERNSTILNSWIITYDLCRPFVCQVETLNEFVENIARLSNIDETSLKHIRSKLQKHKFK